MKNECKIVRDVLPLYLEDMVSEETADFVKEHLSNCAECSAELESMKADEKVDTMGIETSEQRKHGANAIVAIKKKIRKRKWIAVAITAGCLLAAIILFHTFPIYRVAQVGGNSYYNGSEIAKLIYIGSSSDRAEAQSILRQADVAFHDHNHTSAENEELYGVLSRYATDSDRYDNVAFVNHSLELWSAHLGDTEGYVWVYYSYEAFDYDGDTVHGSWKVPSLWKVEKNVDGVWVVVSIKEHP